MKESRRSFARGEIGSNRGADDIHDGLWKKSDCHERGNQQRGRNSETESKVAKLRPTFRHCSHEGGAISPQHINRRNDDPPKRQHRRDLEKMKPLHFPTVTKCSEEDHDFRGKVRQSRQTNRSESPESEDQARKRHHFGETSEIIER